MKKKVLLVLMGSIKSVQPWIRVIRNRLSNLCNVLLRRGLSVAPSILAFTYSILSCILYSCHVGSAQNGRNRWLSGKANYNSTFLYFKTNFCFFFVFFSEI